MARAMAMVNGSYPLGMAFGLSVFEVKGITQRFKRYVIGALQLRHGMAKLFVRAATSDSRFD